ncbi:sugar ABC transporter permease [Ruminococcaceae bacterium OttesenSCG-928-O06]|nr:sugar ABC transporter permease [Ruminococcaceae bacterium OttesenSCG-928-O06]
MRKDSSAAKPKRRKRQYQKQQVLTALLFLAPSLAGVCVFVLVPFVETVRRSFFNVLGNRFQGLSNYISVFQNPGFRMAAANTARFVAICVPLLILISMLMAVLVRRLKPEIGKWFKTTYLVTMAIPVASVVLLWKALFANNGIMNNILVNVFDASPVSFMSTDAAFWVLIFTYLWKNCGYDMILWLAGFDNINAGLYEAARVDGANEWQVFIHVTLPGLLPTLFLITVLSLINTFKVFREAYLVGGAYPESNSIYLLQHLFNNWYTQLDVSRLCAAAVLLAVVLLGIILLLKRAWGDEEE